MKKTTAVFIFSILGICFLYKFGFAAESSAIRSETILESEPLSYQTIKLYSQQSYADTSLSSRLEKEAFIANRYKMFLTGKGESKISNIKFNNPGIQILRYVKGTGIRGPADSVCYDHDHGEENSITKDDPDWPLWQAASSQDLFWHVNGEIVRNPDDYNGWCYIDIIDPKKRALWIEALKENISDLVCSPNVNGVFIDNLMIPFNGYASFNVEDDLYLMKDYYEGLKEIVKELHDYFQSDAYQPCYGARPYLLANAYNNRNEVYNPNAADPEERMDYRGLELLKSGLDGMMRETLSFKSDQNFYPTDRYLRSLKDFKDSVEGTIPGFENSGSKNVVILDDLTDNNDILRREYSLSSYLLMANNDKGNAYHFLWGNIPDGEIHDYPEQVLDLGRPLEAFKAIHNGVEIPPEEALTLDFKRESILLKRNYEKGTVVAAPNNPSAVIYNLGGSVEKLVISAGGTWIPEGNGGTLTWEAVNGTSYTLEPNSALIFRASSSQPSESTESSDSSSGPPSDSPVPADLSPEAVESPELPYSVEITSPSQSATVSGDVKITASAHTPTGVKMNKVKFDIFNYDKTAGKASADYIISQTVYGEGPDFEYLWKTNSGSFPDGDYLLRARAYDRNSNRTDTQIIVSVKNEIPKPSYWAEITSPREGDTVSGRVKISATAHTPAGVKMKKVKFDIFTWDVIKQRAASDYIISETVSGSGPGFDYTWDTKNSKFPSSFYQIRVRAYDISGNRTDATAVVYVKN